MSIYLTTCLAAGFMGICLACFVDTVQTFTYEGQWNHGWIVGCRKSSVGCPAPGRAPRSSQHEDVAHLWAHSLLLSHLPPSEKVVVFGCLWWFHLMKAISVSSVNVAAWADGHEVSASRLDGPGQGQRTLMWRFLYSLPSKAFWNSQLSAAFRPIH